MGAGSSCWRGGSVGVLTGEEEDGVPQLPPRGMGRMCGQLRVEDVVANFGGASFLPCLELHEDVCGRSRSSCKHPKRTMWGQNW